MKRSLIALAALTLLASPAFAQTAKPELNLCTGGETGKYYQTAREIASQLSGTVKVNVLTSKGSLDNLSGLDSGACDAAIVQSDAYGNYVQTNPVSNLNIERVVPLYNEYAHLICNKDASINKVSDLLKNNRAVAIGEIGTGTRVTWDTWVKQNPDYAKVPVTRDAGTRAVTKAVDGTEVQCFLFVAGLNSGTINKVNNDAGYALRMVSIDDGSFDDVMDPKGKRVYEFTDMPKVYPALQDFGFFHDGKVRTLAIGAILVANVSWVDANVQAYGYFADEALRWVKANNQ
jgi:TRAP transporter TAXI family solute receptor